MTFPSLDLPIPLPSPPMEAKRVESIPKGDQWVFEPKWDGFRALVYRDGDQVVIQSKNQRPLTRYFPELAAAFAGLSNKAFVIDGEITIPVEGRLSFDDLLLRIHPAESRVRSLAENAPATFIAFDLLCRGRGARNDLSGKPFRKRREELLSWFESVNDDRLALTPSSDQRSEAQRWFRDLSKEGLDGVMAKRGDLDYRFGERDGMQKVKHFRTVDCVVAGYRMKSGRVGSLVLGLFDEKGRLHHVGHTSALPRELAEEVTPLLQTIDGASAFDVGGPGGPSRWSKGESGQWQPVEPRLVAEVRYDHFSQGRFRHGSKFIRWRPDKDPEQCLMDQVVAAEGGSRLLKRLGIA